MDKNMDTDTTIQDTQDTAILNKWVYRHGGRNDKNYVHILGYI